MTAISVLIVAMGLGSFYWMVHNALMSVPVYVRLSNKFPKPFGCVMCFCAWATILTQALSGSNILTIAVSGGIAGIVAELIERKVVG